jgi:hypothetical protein
MLDQLWLRLNSPRSFPSALNTCIKFVKNGEIVVDGNVIDGKTRLLYIDTTTPLQSNWYRLIYTIQMEPC